jgi:CRP/FNR family cyclic AMP-dependent transcriptional regulator
MSDAAELLRRLPLFATISPPALDAVAERTVPRTVAAGTRLFAEGEVCQGLYVVASGRVAVYRASPDGREQVLHVQEAGQPIAEVPLFDGGPYPASARTLEDSRLFFLPRDAFEWLYRNNPEVADAVIRDLGRRLRRMVRLVEKISLRDVPARVAATIREYADAAAALDTGAPFRLPRTQEALAAELATTREGVARALAQLRKDGIIEQKGAMVRVLDAKRLRQAGE